MKNNTIYFDWQGNEGYEDLRKSTDTANITDTAESLKDIRDSAEPCTFRVDKDIISGKLRNPGLKIIKNTK